MCKAEDNGVAKGRSHAMSQKADKDALSLSSSRMCSRDDSDAFAPVNVGKPIKPEIEGERLKTAGMPNKVAEDAAALSNSGI
jgi:hypothetical protein